MNLAPLLIPASLDANQALRLRRFGVAALSYALAAVLVAVAWAFGVLPRSAALQAMALYVALNLGLYAAIRSGFNLRFADPSLTLFQILAAITVLMYIVYHMDAGRDIALLGCFVIVLFGIFRLNAREFILVTLYALAAYALVINLLMHLRPQAIRDVPGEWMSWLMLAGLLPCFAIIGGQINKLRRRLRDSELRFRSLTEMSSDFYWESDAEHRLTRRASADKKLSAVTVFRQGAQVGQRRWEIPYLSPDEAGWRAHRAVLDAHLPFRDFELSRLGLDGTERHISISGDPVFDESRVFKGYRGVGSDISARKQAEQALRESAAQLRLFTDNVPAMTALFDENLRFVFANKRYADFFGFSQMEIIGRHLREIVGEKAYGEIEGYFAQAMQGLEVTYQRTREFADGESRYLEVKVLPHIGDQGKVLGCFIVTSDITAHAQAEQALRESAEKLRLFADNVPAMTVSWDENLRCRFANKVFTEFFRVAVEDIIGKHVREVLGEAVFREIEGHLAQALQGHPVTYERTRKLENGEVRHLEIKLLPHIGDQGKVLGCFAVTTDITEHKLTEERIQRVAHHDSLTGLPNRLLFNDRLNQAVSLAKRDSRQFALLYLDLDKFKPVNDILGHGAGDELLKNVATRIRHQVRESDTVARVGGDEFTVILPNIARREEAENVARKIIAAVAAPFELGSPKQSVDIGTSIGIALYPADGRDADALVKAADAAMYSAKQAGNSFRSCAA